VPEVGAVKEGLTTRRELEQILAPFVTSASDETFFWARWEQISSPVACYNAGDNGRDWARINVLAISDASGVLKYYRRCSERDLLGCLALMANNLSVPPSDSDPISLSVSHQGAFVTSTRNDFYGDAVFDKEGLHLRQTAKGFERLNPPVSFEVAVSQIEKLEITDSGFPGGVDMKLRFRPETLPVPDLSTYRASPRDTWRLVQYLRSLNPGLLGTGSR
jgi:hypothetical protein